MPALLQLEVRTTCNTPDEDIVAQIRASKERGGKWLESLTPANGRTLLIAGSGPSAWKALESINGIECDVMALNGAYAALIDRGYPVPKFYAQLDARQVNVNFLRDARKETQYLLASQVHPDTFDLLRDFDVTTFHLNTETEQQVFGGTEGLFYGSAGGTIGSTALALAATLGYRHLVLVGYDSSFDNGKSHLVPQSQNDGQRTLEVEFNGKWYKTTPTLAGQVNEFFPWNQALHNTFPDIVVDLAGEGLFYDFVEYNTGFPPCITTREQELARYPAIYAEDPEYRCTLPRLDGLMEAFLEIPEPRETLTYLDISCGRGESLDLATRMGFADVRGTETVPALIAARDNVTSAVLPDTGLAPKCADVVCLIEVIEHLVPDDVEPALRELERLARKYVLVSAATFPSWRNGANLHPSARTEEEWAMLFEKLWPGKARKLKHRIHPSPAWIITL
jgi:hypothetical protein